jgi:tRNA threonylcarbamoyladenosine biosynthesis protein TsaE
MTKSLHLLSRGPEDTQHIGMQLGKLARAGDVFLLSGKLGAGKTCLAQGIAWGLGFEEYVSSPSFVVVREYHGRIPMYHIDLYRLAQLSEILELGLDDYLYDGGVCVVEWAEKVTMAWPNEHMLIRIEYVSDIERWLCLEPSGERYSLILSDLRREK